MKKHILKNRIKEIVKDKPIRMHMPGHKGKKQDLKLDITEIDGVDNLHHANGIIQDVQNKIAKIYGSQNSYLLVDGSTVGIQASILDSVGENDKILIPTNSHRSVFPALSFSRAKPVYFNPEVNDFSMTVSKDLVDKLLKENPDAKAILVVSPDYYGNISDLKEISKLTKERGVRLIVDEAHGAHLNFLPEKLDGVSAGADYVIQSTHKILGAPTQSSVLHTNNDVDSKKLKKTLALLESSSPSYLLMSGIEEAIDEAENKAEKVFSKIYHAHDGLEQDQTEKDLFKLITPEGNYDKSKFIFSYPEGYNIRDTLINKFRIIPEIIGPDYVLLMTGIGTSQRDLNRLFGAIKQINQELEDSQNNLKTKTPEIIRFFNPDNISKQLYEVLTKSGETVLLEDAENKIALDFIVPYPPGIPVLIPGSKITKDDIEYLNKLIKKNTSIQGIDIDSDYRIWIEVLDENNSN